MVVRPSGRTTRRREELFANAASAIATVPVGTVTSESVFVGRYRTRVRPASPLPYRAPSSTENTVLAGSTVSEARMFEPTNADSPMEATPEPRWTEVRAVSLEKAPLPIEVTESGSVAEVSAVVSKA